MTHVEARAVPEAAGAGAGTLDLGVPVDLTWGWATDTGRRRSRNEDAAVAETSVFCVADGMGGHARGDVASRVVAEHIGRLVGRLGTAPEDCADTVRDAAAAVSEIAADGRGAAGSTLSGALAVHSGGGPYWLVVNIGDSRTYLWRAGRLEQVTVDHSAVREMVDAGEITAAQARVHPERNVITRAIGSDLDPRADVWMVPLHPGDVVVACTDGVTGEVDDDELAALVATGGRPAELASRLVAAAVAAGGRDNATAVVVAAGGTRSPDDDVTEEMPRHEPEEDTR